MYTCNIIECIGRKDGFFNRVFVEFLNFLSTEKQEKKKKHLLLMAEMGKVCVCLDGSIFF